MYFMKGKKGNLVQYLAANAARTIGDGMLAAERCLAGNARAGDQERVQAALDLSDRMREYVAGGAS